ncbi:hypothetical protein PsYK624_100480 [Phanerochaete sordida]|uniref:Uncharacterized protein n=1 Tax=Phanerochaete sordida TaxID=48140 RepID=A0A9P3LGK4_9APHY|nr:hypothetical protein PsYK624_100480 [Phanerochaete sordida]
MDNRKPPFRLPSASHIENPSRVRGRTQLRQQQPASYAAVGTPFSAANSNEPGPSSSGPSSSGGVNKIWSNVRRSISHGGGAVKKGMNGIAATGMRSTPEESLPPPSSPSYSHHDSQATSPTIEQIAMGLHISRTPHLGSSPRTYHARSRYSDSPETPRGVSTPSRPSRPLHVRRGSAPAISLPPPPARSSLKKPVSLSNPLTPSDSNVSLSTLTSTAPSTPRSNRSASTSTSRSVFSSKLHLGMRLLLPSRKNSSSSAVTLSDDDSASSELTPRKVVRFSVVSGESEEGP